MAVTHPTTPTPPPGTPLDPLPEPMPPHLADTRRVLVVEDHAGLRRALEQCLQRLGFTVTAVDDGPAALETFRAAPRTFQVVITDLNLPQMSGLELAEQVLQIRPNTPLLLTSGAMSTTLERKAHEAGFAAILPKPFGLEDIRKVLHKALEMPSPGPDVSYSNTVSAA